MHDLANQGNPSPTRPSNGPLDSTQLAYLWTRMIARYGHRWTSQFGDRPVGAAAAEWAQTLAGLGNAALTAGFEADAERGDDWPPSSTKFRAMCVSKPDDGVVRTYVSGHYHTIAPRIESDASRAAAKRELCALCEKLGIDVDLDAAP